MDLKDELTRDQVDPKYQPIVDLIGIENFLKLCEYIGGDAVYFPRLDTVLRPVVYEHMKHEYNGYNEKELAMKYGVTVKWATRICRGNISQTDIFEYM